MIGAFFGYGFVLQILAILHFVRRRPETYWLFIILMGGAIGALVYIVAEVIPDAGLLRGTFEVFPRRKRIAALEAAVLDNPSAGNYEELADLYLDDKQYAKARQSYDRAITPRTDSPDPFYRRAQSEISLGDFQAALTDLEHVVRADPKYDSRRAAGLLACMLWKTGQRDRAGQQFAEVLEASTLSETQYNYACYLADEGRNVEAREWAQRVLNKKLTLPSYLRRRERPWFRRAGALLKRLPAGGDTVRRESPPAGS
jgi:hypothetical protein